MFKRTTLMKTMLGGAVALILAFPAWGQQEQTMEQRLAVLEAKVARAEQQPMLELGHQIYEVACMTCHGKNGDGHGPSAKWMDPKPRNLTMGMYKWRTTGYGALPTDEDLERVIRVGVSTTDMPPFGEILSRRSRMAVVEYIKTFHFGFSDPGQQPKGDAIVTLPAKRSFNPSPESVAKGKELFTAHGCTACHGPEGEGDGVAANGLIDAWGFPIRPWDFSLGYYKSGATEFDLFRTVTTGMSGTPMTGYGPRTTEDERWQLVDYVMSLGAEHEESWMHELFADEPSGKIYDAGHHPAKINW